MRLNLTKPLVVFDLEATGLDLVNDRIIQISYVKVSPGWLLPLLSGMVCC